MTVALILKGRLKEFFDDERGHLLGRVFCQISKHTQHYFLLLFMLNYSVAPGRRAFLLNPFFLMIVCALSLYGCKKGSPNNPKPGNSAAIIGKWLLAKQTIQIYSASGALARDTTNAFGVIQAGINSYQTFNKDGSSVTLNNADTTGIYTYNISGNVLTIYPSVDHASYNLYGITSLDETNMELESIFITSQLPTLWGLDPTGSYKVVTDDYFTRN